MTRYIDVNENFLASEGPTGWVQSDAIFWHYLNKEKGSRKARWKVQKLWPEIRKLDLTSEGE